MPKGHPSSLLRISRICILISRSGEMHCQSILYSIHSLGAQRYHHLMFFHSSMFPLPPGFSADLCSSMFNVLLILLHRPFVSEGHLHSTSRSIPANSFVVCAQAATRIVQLLRTYEKTFSIRHAPYLIAYATYVSATIHVRIAAQLGPGSEAYTCLRTCLNVFMKNQETNWVRLAPS